jgi:hypothetical protein
MGAMFAFAFVKGVLSRFWGIQWAVSDCGGLANRLAARSLKKYKPKIACPAYEQRGGGGHFKKNILDEAMV